MSMGFRFTVNRKKDLLAGKPYLFVDSDQAMEYTEKVLRNAKICAIDVEGWGVNIQDQHPKDHFTAASAQITARDKFDNRETTIFIPNWGRYSGTLGKLKKPIESVPFYLGHNMKFDAHVLANHGIYIEKADKWADTMVMDVRAHSEQMTHGLKECMYRYLDIVSPTYDEVFKEPKPLKNGGVSVSQTYIPPLNEILSRGPEWEKKLIDYAVKDPIYTLKLYDRLMLDLGKIQWYGDHSLDEYFHTFDSPYTQVLYRIERRGIRVDTKLINESNADVKRRAVDLAIEFQKLLDSKGLGALWNKTLMSSPKQLGQLFELHLGIKIASRTATGLPSTDDESLSKLHGNDSEKFVKVLREFRSMSKLSKTYLENWAELAPQYGDRIHTNLKQGQTATQRLASAAPNLMNVPAPENDEFKVRKAFIADDDEYVELWDADQSQIELRLMAHFSGDPVMLQALREGKNLHGITAAGTFAEVKDWLRKEKNLASDSATIMTYPPEIFDEIKLNYKKFYGDAKTLNYAIGYGMGAQTYEERTGSPPGSGKRAIDGFFNLYKGLKECMHRTVLFAEKHGYIRTLLNRPVAIQGIDSPVPGIKAQAKRQAFNYLIQSSNADIMMMAMLLVDRCPEMARVGAIMNLQIHDELLGNVPKNEEAKRVTKEKVEEYMSVPYKHFGFKSPQIETPATCLFGSNWAAVH